ncbi:MAG: tyrosine-type recombinase/integrase [Myxococcota bacterium]
MIPAPDLLHAFLRHLAEDERKAASTVAGYRAELELLVRRGVALVPEALGAHLTWLPDGAPVAATTRNRRLSILRAFVRWLLARGELAADPLAGIRRAKVPRRHRSALTAADLERVVGVLLAEPPSWRRTRDGTLLLLFFYTGLRLAEAHRLDVDQVDLAGGVLRGALRKGGDVTDVVLHPCLAAQLAVWMQVRPRPKEAVSFPRGNERPATDVPTGCLFPAERGARLSKRQIQKRLKALGEAAGLGVALHPHLLRHAHATGLLREGVATAVIQQSMNHHALATTELYLHGDLGLVRLAIARLPALPLVPPGDPPRR